MKSICAIFIDQSYSIYHAITMLIEVSKNKNVAATAYCTPRNKNVIDKILRLNGGDKVKIFVVRPKWYVSLPHLLEIKLNHRKSIFNKYSNKLKHQDAIICTLYNDLEIKKYIDFEKTKLIFSDHGIPNRPYSYDDRINLYDQFFLTGKIEEKARRSLGQLERSNFYMTGYLKFDVNSDPTQKILFNNKRKTIIYNPHWEKTLSSFDKFGMDLLNFVSKSADYNLIFSPHKLLFTRNPFLAFKLRKYSRIQNIIIDSQSEMCNDLSYIRSSDIYIGDISSQASEFIAIKNRPCIFLKNNDSLKIEDFVSWKFGDVYKEISSWELILQECELKFNNKYKSIQKNMVSNLFHSDGNTSASEKAASSVLNLLMID